MLKSATIILTLVLLSSCQKKPFDVRNKLLGDWKFKVYRSEQNTQYIGYYYVDSVVYKGKVSYGDAEDELKIRYTAENEISIRVNEQHDITGFPGNYHGGEFIGKDSLRISIKWGGLGGGTTHSIYGKKVKK